MALDKVVLRLATIDDADLLLTWANDPASRAASFSSRPIERSEHATWLTGRLVDAACAIWVGLAAAETRPIGVIRFERDRDGIADISVTVAPDARGQGFGSALLNAGLDAARATLGPRAFRAWVKPGNEPSIRLFEAAGFRRRDGDRPGRLEFDLAAS